jgi:hypothetical protein
VTRVFVAGIIQGSKAQELIHEQDYRGRIAEALRERVPDVEIIDPHGRHPERFDFDQDAKRDMFLRYAAEAAKADLLIAFVPEATMGTAVEMFVAHQAGVPVYTVSPMTENWVVFSLSTLIFSDIDELVANLGDLLP